MLKQYRSTERKESVSRRTPTKLRNENHRSHRRHLEPTTQCLCGKARFRDHRSAVEALHAATGARHLAVSLGETTRRKEVRVYACTLCNGYHLTSRRYFPDMPGKTVGMKKPAKFSEVDQTPRLGSRTRLKLKKMETR